MKIEWTKKYMDEMPSRISVFGSKTKNEKMTLREDVTEWPFYTLGFYFEIFYFRVTSPSSLVIQIQIRAFFWVWFSRFSFLKSENKNENTALHFFCFYLLSRCRLCCRIVKFAVALWNLLSRWKQPCRNRAVYLKTNVFHQQIPSVTFGGQSDSPSHKSFLSWHLSIVKKKRS